LRRLRRESANELSIFVGSWPIIKPVPKRSINQKSQSILYGTEQYKVLERLDV
jgi:hypothetical protein